MCIYFWYEYMSVLKHFTECLSLSENNFFEMLLFFFTVESRDYTQDIRLYNKWFYSLSDLTGPRILYIAFNNMKFMEK